jgi:hypothetical protein
MHRTVTALYDTMAKAETARAALRAAHLGDDVDIRDQGRAGPLDSHGFDNWLKGLFGGHADGHAYAEGLRRGHFLLAARVDDLNEIRAAAILDAAKPVDLTRAQIAWRAEGWSPQAEAHAELA